MSVKVFDRWSQEYARSQETMQHFHLNIDQVWTFQQKIPNQSPYANNVTEVFSRNAGL